MSCGDSGSPICCKQPSLTYSPGRDKFVCTQCGATFSYSLDQD